MENWRVAIVVYTNKGLLCDRKASGPGYWKLIEGRKELWETEWEQTACRELAQETDVHVEPADFSLIEKFRWGRYAIYLCKAHVSEEELRWHRAVGDKGEDIRVISYDELATMTDFSEVHRGMLERNEMWPAPLREAA